MFPRTYVGLVLALFGLRVNCVAAATLPPEDAASALPCAATTADPSDLPAAFAYDLESPEILRFVRFLAAVPERDQKRIFKAAVAAANTAPEQGVRAAFETPCPRSDAVYGAFRATYVVVNDWTVRDLKDAARFQAFDAVVATAVSALALGAGVTLEQRLTATQPFIGFDLQVPAQALPTASAGCANVSARVVTIARPAYPSAAIFAQTTGKVDVLVRLSDTGDVRSAKISSDTLGNAIGAVELRRESIFAAATTTYKPAIRDCVATHGSYIFQSEFSAR